MKLTQGQKVTIPFTALSSEGEGIGVYKNFKIFVAGALPGEMGEIEIIEKKERYGRGKLIHILSPSPDRIAPCCPAFGQCGGCSLLHLAYEKQLLAKRERILDAFKRIGHLDPPPIHPTRPSPMPFRYRNKIQLPVTPDEKGELQIGLYRKESHEIIPFSHCHLQCDPGEKILASLRPLLTGCHSLRTLLIRNGITTGEALVVFITRGGESERLQKIGKELMARHPEVKGVLESINREKSNVILGKSFNLLAGQDHISEVILNKRFNLSAPSFFQVNTAQAEIIFQKAVDLAQFKKEQKVLDAYSGVGIFALLAADHVASVIGIEIVEEAVKNATANANLNRISNSTFVHGKAEELFSRFHPIDTLFLNPPRKGCDPSLISKVIANPPKKILYLSCDPATLARDAALLVKGGFQIVEIHPFDMFPHTMHVETLVLFIKKD